MSFMERFGKMEVWFIVIFISIGIGCVDCYPMQSTSENILPIMMILLLLVILIFLIALCLESFRTKKQRGTDNSKGIQNTKQKTQSNSKQHSTKIDESSSCLPKQNWPFTGISNRNLNCYLNAMIQVCASSQMLKNRLNAESNSTESLKQFVKILEDTSTEDSNPHDIYLELDNLVKHCGWDKVTQEDPFQLLSKLLNGLEEFSNKTILPPNYRMCNITKKKHKYQKYLGLSICLTKESKDQDGEEIKALVDNHFAVDYIDGDSEKPTQIVYADNSPDVLLIHVQANEYDYESEQMVKPDYRIIYSESPIELNLPIIDQSEIISTDKCWFQLTGVVEHKGIGISSGHYIAHRRLDKDNWYTIDDETISQVNFGEITKSPYIFMYEKINSK